jgi:hypothetical protein
MSSWLRRILTENLVGKSAGGKMWVSVVQGVGFFFLLGEREGEREKERSFDWLVFFG